VQEAFAIALAAAKDAKAEVRRRDRKTIRSFAGPSRMPLTDSNKEVAAGYHAISAKPEISENKYQLAAGM